MKPCCTILSRYDEDQTLKQIIGLDQQALARVSGTVNLRISGVPEPGKGLETPLLGAAVWKLRLHRSDLGTAVDFEYEFPWGPCFRAVVPGWIPLGATVFIPSGDLGWIWAAVGAVWTLGIFAAAWSVPRGPEFRKLKEIVREALGGI